MGTVPSQDADFMQRALALARQGQLITLDVVKVPAAQFLSKVKEPAQIDLRNQFDSFSDKIAGKFGSPAAFSIGVRATATVRPCSWTLCMTNCRFC